MKTSEIIAALRCCASIGWSGCSFCQKEELAAEEVGCGDALKLFAADRLEKLVDRCARYVEEIAVLRERQRWIPVTERRPTGDDHYLCRYGFEGGKAAFYQTLDYYATDVQPHFQHEGMRGMRVTHWMPLPPAPEVE